MLAAPPEALDDALKPYLKYSAAFHVALGALFLFKGVLPFGKPAPANVYTIDFVGPSSQIVTSGPASLAGASAPAAARAPAKEADEFSTRKRRGPIQLPKPSLLSGYQAPKPAAKPAAEAPSDQPSESASAAPSSGNAATGEAGAGIATDMPNFPYPWYISQVRAGLWAKWSARKPAEALESIIEFSIMPGGGITDLRVEETSGDAAFDLAAMGAAQDASPFPPLPRVFKEPFLKIHVTLKSQ